MKLEQLKLYLENQIGESLEDGRPNWDLPHTKAVVFHVEEIIKHTPSLNLNPYIMVIAAWCHDWGYAELYKDGKDKNYDEMMKIKPLHMSIGGEKTKKLLEEDPFDFLNSEQKREIVHLVEIHDNLSALKSVNELVLMEADTLGGMDISFVTPTFNKDSNDKYTKEVKQLRLPLFITEYGLRKFEEFLTKRSNLYDEK